MEYETESWAVDKLITESNANNLKINPEYQRGRAWSGPQQKQFIDSILRGYPVPTIFLHDKKEETDTKKYDIVDGQQRINALREYLATDYKLLSAKEGENLFPSLVYGQHNDTEWLGKSFNELSPFFQDKLRDKKIPVIILCGNNNEVRDLFIRLQEGSVLNDQERRDAWPGDFTTYIFKIGGRNGMEDEYGREYKPHRFFEQVMRIKPPREPKDDRGKVRKIAAQMYQMHASYENGLQVKGIGKTDLNRLYMANAKFEKSDPQGTTREQFVKCLRTLNQIFDAAAKRNQGNQFVHGAIHLMLLVTTLLKHISEEDCVAIGKNLRDAHKDFYIQCDEANGKTEVEKEQDEYWLKYRRLTSQQADSPRTIKRRHAFFVKKMAEKMSESGATSAGPNPNPRAPEILRRVCEILDQEAHDLHGDLFNDGSE